MTKWHYLFDLGLMDGPQPGPGDSWFVFFRCICDDGDHRYHMKRLEHGPWEIKEP